MTLKSNTSLSYNALYMLLTKANSRHTFESQPFIWLGGPIQLGSIFGCLGFVMLLNGRRSGNKERVLFSTAGSVQ